MISFYRNKKIKEVVKYTQFVLARENIMRGTKNPNDKIYMMMNKKDAEAYQKSYEEIDIF